MTNNREFDVVIYGASGCMGKSVVLQAVQILQHIKWAIAGRSVVNILLYQTKTLIISIFYIQSKLKFVLNDVSQRAGVMLNDMPILLANANDQTELELLVAKCKV